MKSWNYDILIHNYETKSRNYYVLRYLWDVKIMTLNIYEIKSQYYNSKAIEIKSQNYDILRHLWDEKSTLLHTKS